MEQAHPSKKKRVDASTYGPLVALLLLSILGAVLNENFLSRGNLSNVLTRSACIGIIAIGATFVIISGAIDLSVGAMVALITGATILAMNHWVVAMGAGWSVVCAGMGLALALGAAAGWLNGLITTKGRVDAFIVTLGTMGIFRGLVTELANGGTITLDNGVRDTFRPVYYGEFLRLPYPVWILAVMALLATVLLRLTRFGRYCQAIGSNIEAARYSAIPVDRIRIIAFAFQGVCVAVATIVFVPRLGSASSATAAGWELEAITAVIIGGTLLKGGSGRIWGTVVGVLLLTLIGNILNLTEAISQYLNPAVQGVIILIAALLQRSKNTR